MGYQVTDQTDEDLKQVSHSDEDAHVKKMVTAATGTTSPSLQSYRMEQVMEAISPDRSPEDYAAAQLAAILTMAEISPRHGIETMIAGQMVALKDAGMDSLKRASYARMHTVFAAFDISHGPSLKG